MKNQCDGKYAKDECVCHATDTAEKQAIGFCPNCGALAGEHRAGCPLKPTTDTSEMKTGSCVSWECHKKFHDTCKSPLYLCACECHLLDTSDWRERFSNKFGDRYNNVPGNMPIVATGTPMLTLIRFIEKELESERNRLRVRGELGTRLAEKHFEAGKEAGREEALSTVKIGRNSEIVIGSPCWRAAMTEGRAAEKARLQERIAFLPAPPQWTEQSWHEAKADILNLLN